MFSVSDPEDMSELAVTVRPSASSPDTDQPAPLAAVALAGSSNVTRIVSLDTATASAIEGAWPSSSTLISQPLPRSTPPCLTMLFVSIAITPVALEGAGSPPKAIVWVVDRKDSAEFVAGLPCPPTVSSG